MGIPRLINLLCDRALLAAFSAEQRTVQPSGIRELAAELRLQSGVSELPITRKSSRIRLDSLAEIPAPAGGTGRENDPGTSAAAPLPPVPLGDGVGQRACFRCPRTT